MKQELELYIHIPFCVKKCEYCDFLSEAADEKTINRYVAALLREIRYYGEHCRDREVSTIYIGGGTPSFIWERYMELILKQIAVSFFVNHNAEVTVECNPGTLTREKLMTYQRCGVNRLSIGLQSALSDELRELGRVHTYEQFLRNFELARELGFANINVDLMSALPHQTVAKFLTSLKRVVALRPEHISAYSLMIEKGTPFYEKYRFDAVKREGGLLTEVLPSEETEYEIGYRTKELLEASGYRRYEVSNYARPGFECRHNIGYWKRADYLGMGLGAASLIDNVRYTNVKDLWTYIKATGHIIPVCRDAAGQTGSLATNLHMQSDAVTRTAQMEEFMFLGLRMIRGITRADFRKSFGVEIEAVYGDVLPMLAEKGLIRCLAGEIRLTEKGLDLSNYVLSHFLLN